MLHVNIWFFGLLASCLLMAFPAFSDETVKLNVATKPAPIIVFKDDQGNVHPLNPQQHKLSIVHFWATWCAPCVAELPEIDTTAQVYAGKDVHTVAISLDGDNSMDKVRQFYAEHKITHLTPTLDFGNASFHASSLQGLPGTLFIDKNGKEIARAEGPLDWKSKEVTEFIEGHLH